MGGVELGGRELSAYDGVDNSENYAISSHVKDKQLISAAIAHAAQYRTYTPCLSTYAPQHLSGPETFQAEFCLLFVVSAQTRS
jgi:hypothetical protein